LKPTISTALAEAQSYTHGATIHLSASLSSSLNVFIAILPVPPLRVSFTRIMKYITGLFILQLRPGAMYSNI
jgi:hypothetical protein